ncbi:MAG: proline--tRNA ligase [Bacteroidota bacterium]
MNKKLTPLKENFSAWYNELVKQADLAEPTAPRGAMIIKPYGYALWEAVKNLLDQKIKETGHQNAYFPLLIPASYFAKEEDHIQGFAKECAIVTHYRLTTHADGKGIMLDPNARLESPLVVRPTSETIIWESFRKWIQSYRDLPMLINQWANVVRWEMRTRPFLRTSEFLWQEGHTAHNTREEALDHAHQMLQVYCDIIRNELAIPLIEGEKTAHERFAGAEATYTMEALMQDGKALQLGTSHFLGQNFAKAFDVRFVNQEGALTHVWGTSWGITTRLIGALIMVHGDDQGLTIPPRIAPIQVVVIPVFRSGTSQEILIEKATSIRKTLASHGIRVKLDQRDTHQPGWKFHEYEKKGVPLRLVLGPRDLANHTIEMLRRDTGEKRVISLDRLVSVVEEQLIAIQDNLYKRALAFQKKSIHYVDHLDQLQNIMQRDRGFVMAHWDGTTATEEAIKQMTQATIRCIPFDSSEEAGRCIYTRKSSQRRVLFATAY